jgi:hypothetical protein
MFMFDELRQFADLFCVHPIRWGFCGGWATDLFIGRTTRPHKDIDVAILRRDQLGCQKFLLNRGWELATASDARLSPWIEGQFLELPLHAIWCTKADSSPSFFEILLNEADESSLQFRRNRTITVPIVSAFVQCENGLSILAPEIVLLYKAAISSAESQTDFHNALPHLNTFRRDWLRSSLTSMYPRHEWIESL